MSVPGTERWQVDKTGWELPKFSAQPSAFYSQSRAKHHPASGGWFSRSYHRLFNGHLRGVFSKARLDIAF